MASTAITPITLEPDAFALKVLEDKLRVEGPLSDGYKYAGMDGQKLYRTPCVIWDKTAVSTATSANPAAGATITVTVPAGKRWQFLGGSVTMVADANVANRYVYINFAADGTNATGRYVCSTAQTAGTTNNYAWDVCSTGTGGTTGAGGMITVGVGTKHELPAGAVITISAVNLQAGDDFSALSYAYKEAPE